MDGCFHPAKDHVIRANSQRIVSLDWLRGPPLIVGDEALQ